VNIHAINAVEPGSAILRYERVARDHTADNVRVGREVYPGAAADEGEVLGNSD
jgi:hypothetical protein